MARTSRDGALRIGELAARAGTSADTVRYYERLGLVPAPKRSESGYRLYSQAEVGRLQFIRRAKQLGLTLDEIRGLLGLAQEGECRPLRREVAELLRRKIEECEAKVAELITFKAALEQRYRSALESQDRPACDCATFPASCACLPVSIDEVISPITGVASPEHGGDSHEGRVHQKERRMETRTTVANRQSLPAESEELTVLHAGCGCGCDGSCGCGSGPAQPTAEQTCGCGRTTQAR